MPDDMAPADPAALVTELSLAITRNRRGRHLTHVGEVAAKLVAEYLVNELIGSGWTFSRRRPPIGHSTHPPKGR
jgi:hypothetical protein